MRASALILALIASLSLSAVSAQTAPKPKAAAAAAKPAEPPVARAKPKLMTRDELRACFGRREANEIEGKAITAVDAELASERTGVLAERDRIKAANDSIAAEEAVLKESNGALMKRYEEIKAKQGDMGKKELAEANADYTKRANEMNVKIDSHNTRKKAFMTEVKAFEERVDDFNKRKELLSERTDKHGDALDAWRAECGNRPYDERDEIALKKEKEAQKK